ncbi:DET1- and DDB1-associated protein 1 [Aegilops tauschii subsp. strangulata]|nr:DET1- and DDB1-associated protein 1 [Aegilops tauschii subsp. strangulata]
MYALCYQLSAKKGRAWPESSGTAQTSRPRTAAAAMGSPLGGWPSHNPQNFSQLVPADPSAQPTNVTPTTYIAAHRTDPPANQVITTEPRNILLRHFYQNSENKPRPKRAAPESAALRNGKQARSPADGGSQSSTRS